MNKHILILTLTLQGCASAWVVKRADDGGVIGYKARGMFSSDASLQEKIHQQIHCPAAYEVVSDELKSSQYLSTTWQAPPQATLQGPNPLTRGVLEKERSESMPVTTTNTDYWRELTYRCVTPKK
jgi:hypothetical protein